MNKNRKKEISFFLEFEINEIESANLTVGEDSRLEEDYKRLSNGKKIASTLAQVFFTSTSGNEASVTGSVDLVGQGVSKLNDIKHLDNSIEALYSELSNIEMLLNDFNRDIHDYINGFELDEERFEAVESRIDQLNHLKMKYGQSIQEIMAYKYDKEKRLDELIHFEAHLHKINGKLIRLSKKSKSIVKGYPR